MLSLTSNSPLVTTSRGSNATSSAKFRNEALRECVEAVKEHNSSRENINIDCDAYSVTISVKSHASSGLGAKKQLIWDCLSKMCGVNSSRSSCPPFVMGGGGVFGCSKRKESPHVRRGYESCEVLVTETPAKIAIHQSCKQKIVDYLCKKKFPVQASPNPTICFVQKGAKPAFGVMVDAILENCYVASNKEYYIHVADFGQRYPICVQHSKGDYCYLEELFTAMDALRNNGVTVELSQLDLAFTTTYVPQNKVIQMSASRKEPFLAANGNTSFLQKTLLKTFPMHNVNFDNDLKKIQDEGGTIQVVNRNACTSAPCMFQMSDEPELSSSGLVCNHYTVKEDGQSDDTDENASNHNSSHGDSSEYVLRSLELNMNAFHSAKVYSDLWHSLAQDKSNIPLHYKQMENISDLSFQQLQSSLHAILERFQVATSSISKYGPGRRLEISIRPTHHDKSLRLKGHLNDIIVHVHASLNDFFHVYTLTTTEIPITSVQSKLQSLINQIYQYLRMRGSSTFFISYGNEKMCSWLKMQMNLVLMTAGFAPSFKLDHVMRWLRDGERFDPYDQCGQLKNRKFLLSDTEHSAKRTSFDSAAGAEALLKLKRVLENNHLSAVTVTALCTHVQTFGKKSSPLKCYKEMPFVDKLGYSCSLEVIVSSLTKDVSVDEETTEKELSENDYEENSNEQHFVFCSPPPKVKHMEHVLLQNVTHDTQCTARDSLSAVIHALTSLSIYFDISSPAYVYHLSRFVIKCHNSNIAIPAKATPLDSFPQGGKDTTQENKSLSQALCILSQRNLTLSTHDLSKLCKHLDVKTSGLSRTAETYIKSLCLHYCFPCLGVMYDFRSYRDTPDSRMNELYNASISEEVVVEVRKVTRLNHITYFRNSDNKQISIMKVEHVAKVPHAPIIFVPSERCRPTTDCWSILSVMLNVHEEDGCHLRSIVLKFLKKTDNFRSMLLNHEGRMLSTFSDIKSAGTLMRKYKFQLEFPDETMDAAAIARYLHFVPFVIFPLLSVIFKVDITYYDLDAEVTYIYGFHLESNKSILYKVNCVLAASHLSLCVWKNKEPEYRWGLTTKGNGAKHKQYISYAMSSHCSHNNTNIGERETVEKKCLSSNSWGPFKTSTKYSISKCLQLFLGDISHYSCEKDPIPECDDPLRFFPFLREVSFSVAHDWAEVVNITFDQSVTGISPETGTTFKTNMPGLMKELCPLEGADRHEFVAPVFCLKYKINVVVWLYSRETPKATWIYYYDKWRQKVFLQKLRGYHEYNCHQQNECTVYLRVSKSTKGYLAPPKNNITRSCDHLELLIHKFSFMDSILFERAYQELRKLDICIHDCSSVQLADMNLNDMNFIPFAVTDKDGNHSQCLISIYPVDISFVHYVCLLSREECKERSQKKMREILSVVFGANVSLYTILLSTDRMLPQIDHHFTLWGYLLPLYIFTAHEIKHPVEFGRRLEAILKVEKLLNKLKMWSIKLLTNNHQEVVWLQSCLSGHKETVSEWSSRGVVDVSAQCDVYESVILSKV